MDLMGLWVFLAMSDASTFHRSRKTCVDISNLETSKASTPRNTPRPQIYHVSHPEMNFGIDGVSLSRKDWKRMSGR